MHKRVQEGDAQKVSTYRKTIHLTTFDLRNDFLLLGIHKKEDNLNYIWHLHLQDVNSH